MIDKLLKLGLFTLIVGLTLYVIDSKLLENSLSDQIGALEFIILSLIFQLAYLPIFEKFKSLVNRYVYKQGNRIYYHISKRSYRLNSVLHTEDFNSHIINSFGGMLSPAKPMILFAQPEPCIIYDSVIPTDLFRKLLAVDSIRSLPELMKSSSESVQKRLIQPEEKEFVARNKVTHLFPLISENKLIGYVFIPKGLSKHFHLPNLLNTTKRYFQKIADLSTKTKLVDDVQLQLLENELLVDIGNKLTSSLKQRDVLQTILEGLKKIVNYDAVGIFLNQQNSDEIKRLITRGYDAKHLDSYKIKHDNGIIGWVYKNKQPMAVPDISNNKYYFNVRPETRSQITVPLIYNDSVIGTFTLESNRINHYTEKSTPLLQTFAKQASIAIMNAHLYEESRKKQILEEEMINAASIQKALLPTRPPKMAHMSASIFNKPCKFLGGDIYDMVRIDDDRLIFAIGDVSGKGTPAGILMAVLFAGLRSEIRRQSKPSISELNARLNHLLYESTSSGFYATFFIGLYNETDQTLTYSNAGHNPPLLIRKNNQIKHLKEGGMVLGFIGDEIYIQRTIKLQSDDLLVLYTDGLNEAFDFQNEEFGEDNIIQTVKTYRDESALEIKNQLIDAVMNHHGQHGELDDDLTLITMKFNFDQIQI